MYIYLAHRVHEIHIYEPSSDLFKSYVRTFLKIKMEAGGMPSYIQTDDDWEWYANEVKHRLDITLVRENMIKNKGLKALAKLMLNSLWGKFGQRDLMPQTIKVKDDRHYELLLDREQRGEVDFLDMQFFDANQAIITLRDKDSTANRANTNVAIAAFVAAGGRLRLLKEMTALDDRVLYHDTDSIIYEHRPNEYNIPEGKFLGEWECETDKRLIDTFVGLAPKTYGYRYTALEKDEEGVEHEVQKINVKCKGFTLNHQASQKITLDTLKGLVFQDITEIVTFENRFVYDKRSGGIDSIYVDKKLMNNYDKGDKYEKLARDADGVEQLVGITILPKGWEVFRDVVEDKFQEVKEHSRIFNVLHARRQHL
jgi:hypothetical protein